jgi:hypothetical protein
MECGISRGRIVPVGRGQLENTRERHPLRSVTAASQAESPPRRAIHEQKGEPPARLKHRNGKTTFNRHRTRVI